MKDERTSLRNGAPIRSPQRCSRLAGALVRTADAGHRNLERCWPLSGLCNRINLSSNGLIEAQWYLFDLIFLLGLGWTLQKQGHVRVDVLQSRWSPRRRNRQELTSILLLLLPFAFGVMVISIAPALRSWSIAEMSPDPGGLPRTWVKSLIPIGFLLLGLQGIAEALRLRLALSNPEATQAADEQQQGGTTL